MTLDRATVEGLLNTLRETGKFYADPADILEDWLRKEEALKALLDYAERYHGGDPTITSEWWYSVRDAARVALAPQAEEEKT